MGLIDTHCHLDLLKGTPDEALAEARAAGVDAVVAVGIDLRSSRSAAALAARFDDVYAAVGVHPHDAVGFDGVVRTGLERLLGQRRVVAVGECGLDFYRDLAPRDVAAGGLRRAARAGARDGRADLRAQPRGGRRDLRPARPSTAAGCASSCTASRRPSTSSCATSAATSSRSPAT